MPSARRRFSPRAKKALRKCGAVVVSDYGKGTLTPKLIAALIAAANKANKPVIVDPKGDDYRIYRGATVITPNRAELSRAVRREAKNGEIKSGEEIAAAATALAKTAGAGAILVTRSEHGMTLVVRGKKPVHIAALPTQVRDVSGAGDTVVATVAAMLALGADLESAARAANAAAAVAVSKRGTAAVTFTELRARLLPGALRMYEEKIADDPELLDERLDEWRQAGLRIGFTNGCFDLLHPGHIRVLAEARAACDRLVVGLNSDASARRLKGPGRPVQDENARAEVLAALEVVDLVVLFGEDTPLKLIRRVRPHVLVKGGDYKKSEVVGREVVERAGGEVILVDLLPGQSTTRLVERANTPRKKPERKRNRPSPGPVRHRLDHVIDYRALRMMREHVLARRQRHALQLFLVGERSLDRPRQPARLDVVIERVLAFQQRRVALDGRSIDDRHRAGTATLRRCR